MAAWSTIVRPQDGDNAVRIVVSRIVDIGADRLDMGWRISVGLKQDVNLLPVTLRRKPYRIILKTEHD